MNNPARILPVLSALTLLASACTDEATDPGALDFRDTLGTCPNCNGGNSPQANDYPVPELNLDGLANDDGIRLMGIISPVNVVHAVALLGDELQAINEFGLSVAEGPSLFGWRLWLRNENDEDEYIHIRGFTWDVANLTNHAIPNSGYAMAYADPGGSGRFFNICPEALTNPDALVTTVIGGETYDRAAKTVNANQQRWFTLACKNEGIFKMKAMGYSPNITLVGSTQPSTPTHRTATLKMITADYCGTGESYTQQGTQVFWASVHGGVDNYPADPAAFEAEAFWDETGALCLTTPRLDESEVACAANLPECDELNAVTSFVWRTAVPVP